MRHQMRLSPRQTDEFRRIVYGYFKKHRRDLPWRRTDDPYAILVSEIMLQQTQVPRVIEKYTHWIRRFPTIHELAAAPFSEVLTYWSGLGYNRRAQYLKRLAETVITEYRGIFPTSAQALRKLPGIGPYTAAAICVFAHNQAIPLLETNVRSVYLHHFFNDREQVDDAELTPLIEQTMDRENPRLWYNALMDYGTYLKSIHPNPSRKSRHYTKQSPLTGSVREIRGWILNQFSHGLTPLPLAEITRQFPDSERVDKAIKSLIKDGLIKAEQGTYTLT